MERKELEIYNYHSGGSNEKNLLEILSENDKIIGDKVIDMNSDDVRKFRVVKKKLLMTVAENKRLKGENEKLKEDIKRLEKELKSKVKAEGKKDEKQVNPENFGKPKTWQQRTSENLSKK